MKILRGNTFGTYAVDSADGEVRAKYPAAVPETHKIHKKRVSRQKERENKPKKKNNK